LRKENSREGSRSLEEGPHRRPKKLTGREGTEVNKSWLGDSFQGGKWAKSGIESGKAEGRITIC